jgi:hypothetical protein
MNELSRRLKEQSIHESNLQMFKRLQVKEPVMNISKIEDEYKYHLKLKKQIQKVGPDFSRLYKEKDGELPIVLSGQSFTKVSL